MEVSRHLVASHARVTIGMPTFNNARTLVRAIASVQGQSFKEWHLIISDDGSKDDSAQIARDMARDDPRISFVQNKEQLGFMNFSVALQQASTDYFVWLAGDDYWDTDFLKYTVRMLDVAPGAVSILPKGAFVGDREKPIPNLGFLKGTAAQRLVDFLAHPGGTRMYGLMRTSAAKIAFPARGMNAYDWYFMISLLNQGPQLSLPQTLLYREETQWIRYAQMAQETTDVPVFQRWPVLEMTLAVLRQRLIPRRAMSAMIGLNLRKHEEAMAVNAPETYLRKINRFRARGRPIAKDGRKMRELAAWNRGLGNAEVAAAFDVQASVLGQTKPLPAVAQIGVHDTPPLTMIVTCRNAANTLPAWLRHAEKQGARAVVIDHGSTDATLEIAQSAQDSIVTRIERRPYQGYFDLTAQLQFKRALMADLGDGWLAHADADEFIDPPKGQSMGQVLAGAEKAGNLAIRSVEHLYLPRFEDEEHDPENFENTMVWRCIMREHDEKQRLFHSSAPLDVWMKTGGHSVSRSANDLAKVSTILRHYPGLSLDALRAQYYSRVFASWDMQKLWHGSRRASQFFDVSAPNPDLFTQAPADPPLCPGKRLPIFRERGPITGIAPEPGDDVCFLADPQNFAALNALLQNKHPGLRYRLIDTAPELADNRAYPMINILSHPGYLHTQSLSQSGERAAAVAWTRRIANTRQEALLNGTPYGELRLEDVQKTPYLLGNAIQRLFVGRPTNGRKGFLRKEAPILTANKYENPVRNITAPLAADLGYR